MREEKRTRLPWLAIVLFIAAAVLIVLSAVGGARAALTVESENYVGVFEVKNIGVVLTEKSKDVEGSDQLLKTLVPEGEKFSLNRTYSEPLATRNSGTIDQYVRVSVYKYWVDKDGNKITTLDPGLIKLTFGDGWIQRDVTKERTVLYYPNIVPVGQGTAPFVTALEIDGALAREIQQTTDGNTVTTTYDYDGVRFIIEADVDAVQTHNAADAIKAAWGVDADISDSGVITAIR